MIPEEYFTADQSNILKTSEKVVNVPVFFPYKKQFEPNDSYTEDELVEAIAYYYNLRKTKIVFSSISEGFADTYIIPMQGIIKRLQTEYQIPLNDFVYISAAFPVKQNIEYYYAMCREHRFEPISVVLTNLLETMVYKDIIPNSDIKIKNKKFVSMNGMPRHHRTVFTMLLIEKNLLDKGYYSFGLNAGRDPVPADKINFLYGSNQLVNLTNRIQDTFLTHYDKFPMRLTIDTTTNEPPLHYSLDDIAIFGDSYFNIVQETSYNKGDQYCDLGDQILISEKTYRSIIYMTPFVLLSRPYSLKALRDYGYKTFSPYINESYDNIEDPEERMLAVLDEVERLCNLSDNEWLTIQRELQSILEYNYKKLIASEFYGIIGNIDGTISQLT